METLTFLFTSSFYPPFHIGGDAVHVSYLAEELAKRGHEVHVLHSLDAYRVKRRMSRSAPDVNGVVRHPIETTFSLSAYAAYVLGSSPPVARRFRALVEKIKPDVVHHHNISLLGYDLLIKRQKYLNLYTAHDYWLICQHNLINEDRLCEKALCGICALSSARPPQLWRHLTGFKKAVENVDVLVAPSNYMREKIVNRFPIRAMTIPNFAPTPPNRIEPSGFSNFLLYIGTIERHKGILALLELWRRVANTRSKLVIVGDGSQTRRVHRLVENLDLQKTVYPLGWTERSLVYALLRDADALVVPSLWPENAPLVSLEALSVGTPVLGSNRGGLGEIISKLDRRLVFSWEEKHDFMRAVSFLYENLRELKSKAKETYRSCFTPEAYLATYAGLLPMRTSTTGNES
jgi:glycosyltransferase involved in cell wall biosynthesis